MGKGNHVFNNFASVVHNAYHGLLSVFSMERHLDAVNNSGGDVDEAKQAFNQNFPISYNFYNLIRNHDQIKVLHETQDDKEVQRNDPNSLAFGESSRVFTESVLKWAYGEEVNPMEDWRQLVNIGEDQTAARNYVKEGSSDADKKARQTRILSLQEFIKGELSKLVSNWLLAIRVDLNKAKRVGYKGKAEDWKKKLKAEIS